MRTLLRERGVEEVGIEDAARWVMGMRAPLPTVIEEEGIRGRRLWRLPVPEAIWEDAPVSRNQSEPVVPAGGTPALASAASRAFGSAGAFV